MSGILRGFEAEIVRGLDAAALDEAEDAVLIARAAIRRLVADARQPATRAALRAAVEGLRALMEQLRAVSSEQRERVP